MKKLLGIVVLGFLIAHNSFAKTVNIEDKILLNVPENFSYIKLETDEAADYYKEFFSSLGDDVNFYYIGTDLQTVADSIALAATVGVATDLEAAASGLGYDNFADAVSAYNEQYGTNYSVEEAKEALGQ